MNFLKKYFVCFTLILLVFSGCSRDTFRRADVKDIPVNVDARVKKKTTIKVIIESFAVGNLMVLCSFF